MNVSQRAARVRVILVRPEQPRNVGAAIRAVANFGAEKLCLVDVRWTAEEERLVRVAAAGAWDVVGGIAHYATLADAAAECDVLAGTSARRRARLDPPLTPQEFFAAEKSASSRVGLVFGPESQGLTAEDLEHCHVCLRFPTQDEFPSLNLAQAVLLALYEASRPVGSAEPNGPAEHPSPESASVGEQEIFLARLEECLRTRAARKRGDPSRAIGQLRRLLFKARPRPGDVALLNNLLSDLSRHE